MNRESTSLENALALLGDDLIMLALPLFLITVMIEASYSSWRRCGWYRKEDFLASMGVMLTTVIVDILPKLIGVLAMIKIHEISPMRDFIGRQWWAWIILFFLDDLTYYWFHRANHEVRFMWAGHVNHHSSQYLNYGTALRQGVGERVYKCIFWLWLPLLGFDVAMVVTMMSLNLFYQFWLHTQAVKKLHRFAELVLNTPSHHRVHHGSNIRYLDCNHAGTLIIWDRLFGTFSEEREEDPIVYGLTKNLQTDKLSTVLLHEYRSMRNDISRATRWQDKLRYLLFAPGWSHDGKDMRARVLRENSRPKPAT